MIPRPRPIGTFIALISTAGVGCDPASPPREGARSALDNGYPPILEAHADYDAGSSQGAEGERMQAFVLPDQRGRAVDFRQFLGFVTVVDVGAVWCAPCREAAASVPALAAAMDDAGPSWFLSVLVEDMYTGPPAVSDAAAWAETFALTSPVLADELQQNMDVWQTVAWPTVFFVAPDGTIARRSDGLLDDDAILDEVRRLLDQHAGELRPR